MHASPSHLSEKSRSRIIEQLNARLAEGLDLHSQIKVAHWNIRGPQFAALHPLFEAFANQLADFNDAFAERAVTLGGMAEGTVRQSAKATKLKDYPNLISRDLEHVALIAERIEAYLDGVRGSRRIAQETNDDDTVDLFSSAIGAFEKNAWFLRATLS
jgi:starvation-inducible DNA-binding protein